jgi:hypothetical protein
MGSPVAIPVKFTCTLIMILKGILEPPAVPPDFDNPIVLPTDNSVSINMRKVFLPLLMTLMFFQNVIVISA